MIIFHSENYPSDQLEKAYEVTDAIEQKIQKNRSRIGQWQYFLNLLQVGNRQKLIYYFVKNYGLESGMVQLNLDSCIEEELRDLDPEQHRIAMPFQSKKYQRIATNQRLERMLKLGI